MANTVSDTPLESIEMDFANVPGTGGTQLNAGNSMAPAAGAPVAVDKGFEFNEGHAENALKGLEPSELASSEQLPHQGMSTATNASSPSQFPSQGSITGSQPKKRGRPRKQLTGAETKSPDGGQSSIATPPPRKRGRPPKQTPKGQPATGDTPTSEDRKLMASIRRSSRSNPNIGLGAVSKTLFNHVQPTQQGHLQVPMTTTGAPQFMPNGLLASTIPHHSPAVLGNTAPAFDMAYPSADYAVRRNGVDDYSTIRTAGNEVSEYNPNSTASNEVIEHHALQQNMAVTGAHQCSCDTVKGVIQDVLFRHSLQEQDVWVVPHAAAVEMHRYFGGGTPVPKTDVLIPAEKVEMIRNLLF
ncbi:hypothetical protein KJ359_010338 [Pestalotiopsis sp. 9143b]|nr:hypothetical protein KJ359_010338 [Pestalotiopsis sp. 9143b]